MVYTQLNKHICRTMVCVLIVSLLTAFAPLSAEPSYAGTKAKIRIPNIYVKDDISQKKLTKKQRKKGWRLVRLNWSKAGSDSATEYIVSVRLNKIKAKTRKIKVTGKTSKILKLRKGKVYRISVKGYHKGLPGKKSMTITYKPGGKNARTVVFTTAYSNMVENSGLQFEAVPDRGLRKTIKWESSNKKILRVNPRGFVNAMAPGNATVTATAHNGVKSSYRVHVMRNFPTTVTISNGKKASMKTGEKLSLQAYTDEAWDRSITWKSSDKSIAKVNKKGVVTAKSAGTVKITATGGAAFPRSGPKATIKITIVGTLEGMVVWAVNAAEDNSIGYSMGTSRTKGSRNRYCYKCVKHASKDYDCASFVAAAIVHGYGGEEVKGLCNNVGGCRSLYNYLLANGWVNKGKIKHSKMKRGDILINPGAHVEIFLGEKDENGNWLNVAAHDDRDGKTGDKSGTEVSVAPGTYFTYYTAVLRKP